MGFLDKVNIFQLFRVEKMQLISIYITFHFIKVKEKNHAVCYSYLEEYSALQNKPIFGVFHTK